MAMSIEIVCQVEGDLQAVTRVLTRQRSRPNDTDGKHDAEEVNVALEEATLGIFKTWPPFEKFACMRITYIATLVNEFSADDYLESGLKQTAKKMTTR